MNNLLREKIKQLQIGQAVSVRRDNGEVLKTTVKYLPAKMPSGDWAVWVHGISGCYDIDRVDVIEEAQDE